MTNEMLSRHCERSEAIHRHKESVDCFVARAPRNDEGKVRHAFAQTKPPNPTIKRISDPIELM
jgi:hypothetical protein